MPEQGSKGHTGQVTTGSAGVDNSKTNAAQKAAKQASELLKKQNAAKLTSQSKELKNQETVDVLSYAMAAFKLCEEATPDSAETKELQQVLDEWQNQNQFHTEEMKGIKLWQKVGFTTPRNERPEWKEVLKKVDTLLVSCDKEHSFSLQTGLKILEGRLCDDEVRSQVVKEEKRVVRFLLSSTFTDTECERNLLLEDVMPHLQEIARKLEFEVVLVEMRCTNVAEDCFSSFAHCLLFIVF